MGLYLEFLELLAEVRTPGRGLVGQVGSLDDPTGLIIVHVTSFLVDFIGLNLLQAFWAPLPLNQRVPHDMELFA
jgi:hypothetical protein